MKLPMLKDIKLARNRVPTSNMKYVGVLFDRQLNGMEYYKTMREQKK